MNHKKIVKTLLITQGGSLVGSRMTSIAIAHQIAYGLAPVSFIIVGPIVDR